MADNCSANKNSLELNQADTRQGKMLKGKDAEILPGVYGSVQIRQVNKYSSYWNSMQILLLCWLSPNNLKIETLDT